MTYEIREKLKSYAESRQDNFKVGFFSSKKKTEQERNNRLKETIELLETIVSTHITAHIKNLMKRMLKDVGLLNDSKTSEINNMSFSLPAEIIVDTMHNGASTTGDAILNYANRVNDAVSRYFVKETEAWKEENIQYIEEHSSTEDEQFNKKTDTLREKQEAILKVSEIEKRVEDLNKLLIAPTLQIRKDSINLLSEWNEERQLFERSIVEYVETTEEEVEAVNAVAAGRGEI